MKITFYWNHSRSTTGNLMDCRLKSALCWGYELATISHKAETVPEEFSLTVHSANEKRITAALVKRGRSQIMTWMHNDLSEGWMTLTVLKATLEGGE